MWEPHKTVWFLFCMPLHMFCPQIHYSPLCLSKKFIPENSTLVSQPLASLPHQLPIDNITPSVLSPLYKHLLIAMCQILILNSLCTLYYLILMIMLSRDYYYPNFMNEKIEALKDEGACPRLQS